MSPTRDSALANPVVAELSGSRQNAPPSLTMHWRSNLQPEVFGVINTAPGDLVSVRRDIEKSTSAVRQSFEHKRLCPTSELRGGFRLAKLTMRRRRPRVGCTESVMPQRRDHGANRPMTAAAAIAIRPSSRGMASHRLAD
jgi:hypothetical protein